MEITELPTTAAPGLAENAEALADTACALHDIAATPGSWSAAAAEDAVEAIEITALALGSAHPAAAAAVLPLLRDLTRLRRTLALPPSDRPEPALQGEGQTVAPPVPITRGRSRRGLGPGYKGLRIPAGRTVPEA
ncbi:hypothetical protein [Streptomyces griseorubiginosus]|jgi:hypothetical protein|uniref:hypothetical protein n=1 Tax=Streptomyces griseorubiginosus TaxID=67304 RepID=UPI002E823AAE|nr:hypothetical protein [Streptomyces griseorubiginosus]WUB58870.1 hypothetical protein OG942_43645 [Streptomyces griseorubiginosus]